ncbi:hypothetical protein FB645_003884 [Coemansia sp. IMI 203386]|nr:hypothetical protein FB645_003884 [Coemansia sp. IMI 203386]
MKWMPGGQTAVVVKEQKPDLELKRSGLSSVFSELSVGSKLELHREEEADSESTEEGGFTSDSDSDSSNSSSSSGSEYSDGDSASESTEVDDPNEQTPINNKDISEDIDTTKENTLVESSDGAAGTRGIQASKAGKEKIQSKTDLVRTAHRTMYVLVSEREKDITRRIIECGDTRTGKPGLSKVLKRKATTGMVAWPAVDIATYQGVLQPDIHPCMGMDPFNVRGRQHTHGYVDMDLEEPGAGELDVEAISDSARNGGIGLLIRHGERDDIGDRMHIVTGKQLQNSGLLEPSSGLMAVPDTGCRRNNVPYSLNDYFQPLIGLTQTQVLRQVQQTQEPDPSSKHHQQQLSAFVSQTIAREAVHSMARTFDRLADILQGGTARLSLGSVSSGWISVLKSALAAGVPPEVVARAYHRLAKLCDVPSSQMQTVLAVRLRETKFVESRKLPDN